MQKCSAGSPWCSVRAGRKRTPSYKNTNTGTHTKCTLRHSCRATIASAPQMPPHTCQGQVVTRMWTVCHTERRKRKLYDRSINSSLQGLTQWVQRHWLNVTVLPAPCSLCMEDIHTYTHIHMHTHGHFHISLGESTLPGGISPPSWNLALTNTTPYG